LHISGADFSSYFGGGFQPDGVEPGMPSARLSPSAIELQHHSNPPQSSNAATPDASQCEGFGCGAPSSVAGGFKTIRGAGKNSSEILLDFSLGKEDNLVTGVLITQIQ
jgi:hypothetical protein